MRQDPNTLEKFEPIHQDHFFISKKSFEVFIDESDPMEEFVEAKESRNWGPFERECRTCGANFTTTHPATWHCPDHFKGSSLAPKKENKSPEERLKALKDVFPFAKIKECDSCEREFFATQPAMKYCEDCSKKGGELVYSS